jgi:hypothetical protein
MALWDWDLHVLQEYVGEPTRLYMHRRLVLGIGEMRLGCIDTL